MYVTEANQIILDGRRSPLTKPTYTQPMDTTTDASRRLLDFLEAYPRLVILTGAGVSAASGIPTYRDHDGNWLRSEPIQHQSFISQLTARQRYWGRSMRGWPGVRDARPNSAHRALARLERMGRIELLITQNVDRLHQRAGSDAVVDLHGRLDQVVCLDCGVTDCREVTQQQLERSNGQAMSLSSLPLPDGDADIDDSLLERISTPVCRTCAGTLMPDVVFFGGSVPSDRVAQCIAAIDRADALLVVGSSLRVYSGYRFCRKAAELGRPIAVLNPGTTRADHLATLKLDANCAPLLADTVDALARAESSAIAGLHV